MQNVDHAEVKVPCVGRAPSHGAQVKSFSRTMLRSPQAGQQRKTTGQLPCGKDVAPASERDVFTAPGRQPGAPSSVTRNVRGATSSPRFRPTSQPVSPTGLSAVTVSTSTWVGVWSTDSSSSVMGCQLRLSPSHSSLGMVIRGSSGASQHRSSSGPGGLRKVKKADEPPTVGRVGHRVLRTGPRPEAGRFRPLRPSRAGRRPRGTAPGSRSTPRRAWRRSTGRWLPDRRPHSAAPATW